MFDASLLLDLTTELPRSVRQERLVSAIRVHFGCGAVGLLKLDGDCLCPVAVDGLAHETLGRRFVVGLPTADPYFSLESVLDSIRSGLGAYLLLPA